MTIYKVDFGSFSNTLLFSTRAAAEEVIDVIHGLQHQQGKIVRNGTEISTTSVRVNGQTVYLAPSEKVRIMVEELVVFDQAEITCLARDVYTIDAKSVLTTGSAQGKHA